MDTVRAKRAGDTLLGEEDAGAAGLLSQLEPRLANAMVATVFVGFATLAFVGVVFQSGSLVQAGLSLLFAGAVLALQLGYFSRPGARMTRRTAYGALALQACLVYLPILQFGPNWHGFPGFLAGSALIALPARFGVPVFAAVVASMGVIEALAGADGQPLVYAVTYKLVATTITGLVVYSLTRLSRLVVQMDNARHELSRMAVAEERLRLARDVHDLLGLSLSAITLKTELTYRLMNEHPERARNELKDVLMTARRALSDVRLVAAGRRELSLAEECTSARLTLEAADVEVRLDVPRPCPAGVVGTVLATVLREAMTNVLRHSKAEHCEITIRLTGDAVEMDVVNDGTDGVTPDTARGSGNGVQNMTHRVMELGGTLSAGPEEDGGSYRLSVRLPRNASARAGAVTASPTPARSGSRRPGSGH